MERKFDCADTHGYLIWWQAKALFGRMVAFVKMWYSKLTHATFPGMAANPLFSRHQISSLS